MQRNYKYAPSSPLLEKIFHTNEKLATLHSLDSHMIAGLKRVVILEKKAEEAQRQLDIDARKALADANKQQKEMEKQRRAKKVAERRVEKAAEIEHRKKEKEAANTHRKKQEKFIRPTKIRKSQKNPVLKPIVPEKVEVATLRGRRIQRPQRFNI
jgi:hypothetical protein